MRVLFLGNNWVGWQTLQWLRGAGAEIAGLVLHPQAKARHGAELRAAAALPESAIFGGSTLGERAVLRRIAELRADIAVSVLFDYILKPDFLALFPRGTINLHPALLPYNRGQYPNVWSIVEGTPAGATLHYIDEGIDTGAIIAQRQVAVDPADTGETLYRKLERASLALFQETWPAVVAGEAPVIPQAHAAGTFHRTRDVERIDEIDLDRSYTARELIDILRARTFPPYRGAYFRAGGRKIPLRLQLEYDDGGG
jgi:methionyl-tRNA formyltransferase